jgi:hypothetical protein
VSYRTEILPELCDKSVGVITSDKEEEVVLVVVDGGVEGREDAELVVVMGSKVSSLYVGIKQIGCSLKVAKGVLHWCRSSVSWSYFNSVSKSCF